MGELRDIYVKGLRKALVKVAETDLTYMEDTDLVKHVEMVCKLSMAVSKHDPLKGEATDGVQLGLWTKVTNPSVVKFVDTLDDDDEDSDG